MGLCPEPDEPDTASISIVAASMCSPLLPESDSDSELSEELELSEEADSLRVRLNWLSSSLDLSDESELSLDELAP